MRETLHASIRTLIEEQAVLWVLVNSDATARVAVPFEMPLVDLYGEAQMPTWVDPAGSPLDRELQCIVRFLDQREGCVALVSVIMESPLTDAHVRSLLPPGCWRELAPHEYDDLRALEMDVPMGPWAKRETARIYLLSREGEA